MDDHRSGHMMTSKLEAEMKFVKRKTNRLRSVGLLHAAIFALIFSLGVSASFAARPQQKSFASAEEAVKAAIAAAKANNDKELLAIFGANAKDIISAGDAVADKVRRAQFLAAYDEKNRVAKE